MFRVALSVLIVIGVNPALWAEAYSPEEIQHLLDANPSYSLLPELHTTTPEAVAGSAPGKAALDWARTAPDTIPQTTYTQYRTYQRTGDRIAYQTPYFDKREQLTQEVLAAWLTGNDERMDQICDLIWNICEETTWVVPAHEKVRWIDLFAAETGVELAHMLTMLGDRLPEEVHNRVRAEIEARILTPYLEHAREHWWDSGRNNWTGVCAGSVGQTFLLLETDTARQAEALAIVLDQLDRFIEIGFEPDGGCLEGVGYWNYGLLHYVSFAEMLRARTGGAIDLLAGLAIKDIARYPLVVLVGKDRYASFSDSSEKSAIIAYIAARFAERGYAPELLGLTEESPVRRWRFCVVLRNLLWWDGVKREPPPCQNAFLPESGIGKLVGETAGLPVVIAAKAGHNAESHNHNDVGSFIVRAGDKTYLCDPGRGLYTKYYFSDTRYDNIFTNSLGHSVPRIGGNQQSPGREFRGAMEKLGDNGLKITFHEAYDVDGLKQAVRTLTLRDDGSMCLTDSFRMDSPGLAIEEAFMTWQKVELDGNTARIKSEAGVLELRTHQGTFAMQTFEEECKANHREGVLKRISVSYPAATDRDVSFELSYKPAQ